MTATRRSSSGAHVFSPAADAGRRSDHVAREIRKAIVRRDLPPGHKLPPEQELAQQFGVSRPALREALKSLELSGYLAVRRGYGGGTFVSDPVEEEFTTVRRLELPTLSVTARQLIEVRLAIEPRAASIAAGAPFEDVLAIHEAAGRAERADGRPARLLAALVDFHVAVAGASGNPVFVAVVEGMRPVMYRALNRTALDPAWRGRCLAEHAEIVAAIERREPAAAERAMLRHLAKEGDPVA